MVKKIKLILHYGDLHTEAVHGRVMYVFEANTDTVTMGVSDEFRAHTLEEVVKEVLTHIPNPDKL